MYDEDLFERRLNLLNGSTSSSIRKFVCYLCFVCCIVYCAVNADTGFNFILIYFVNALMIFCNFLVFLCFPFLKPWEANVSSFRKTNHWKGNPRKYKKYITKDKKNIFWSCMIINIYYFMIFYRNVTNFLVGVSFAVRYPAIFEFPL